MKENTRVWQRRMVKNSMAKYRQAVEDYYIKDKKVIDMGNGHKAFSLLSPPIASPAAKRRIRLIMDNIMYQQKYQQTDKHIPAASRTPHFVTMAVTYQCQCDCSHCSAAEYQKQTLLDKSGLSFTELSQAVKQTIDLGATSIVFTGGEPLLYDKLFELIKKVDPAKAICTVFTNGEYLDHEAVAKLKAAGVYGVFVSLDHTDPSEHEKNRKRKGIFDKACAGIKLCQEQGILTGISTFVTRQKLESGQMHDMMELSRQLGVLEVFIFDVIPTGKLNGKNDCLLQDNDFDLVRQLRAEYNQKPAYPRIIHQTMLTSIAYPCTGEGCPAGVAHFHLRANGDVSPCDFSPFSFGNIRKEPLKKIWDTISSHPAYAQPASRCRLSNPQIWEHVTDHEKS